MWVERSGGDVVSQELELPSQVTLELPGVSSGELAWWFTFCLALMNEDSL